MQTAHDDLQNGANRTIQSRDNEAFRAFSVVQTVKRFGAMCGQFVHTFEKFGTCVAILCPHESIGSGTKCFTIE